MLNEVIICLQSQSGELLLRRQLFSLTLFFYCYYGVDVICHIDQNVGYVATN
jgi:hypothetical protein